MRENTSRVTGAFFYRKVQRTELTTIAEKCKIVAEAIRRLREEMASGAWLTVASDKRQAMVSNFGDGAELGGNGFQEEANGLRKGAGVIVQIAHSWMCGGMGTMTGCALSRLSEN